MGKPDVAIIVVTYNSESDIEECLEHICKLDYPPERLHVYLHDNASTDRTPVLLEDLCRRLPCQYEVTLCKENLGFTGGNNAAAEKARKDNCSYVFLLNPDAFVEPQCLVRVLHAMESHPQWALAQPLLILAQQPELLNSTGNGLHLLGFGMVMDSGKPRASMQDISQHPIGFPSGAACLIRLASLEPDEVLFDPTFFAYHEDCELAWRLKVRGWEAGVVPDAVVAHRYAFSKGPRKFYLLERNRWLAMLTHYRVASLLMLSPLLLLTDIMVVGHAVLNGWLALKCRVFWDIWCNRHSWIARRKDSAHRRKLRDRTILEGMSLMLTFPEGTPWPVRWVLNPVSWIYGTAVRWLVWW